jgi:AcrR family transcriptional regulator
VSSSSTREPQQKRSIEKKTKIIKAGLDLFNEKGYYKTNTMEIANAAGVSTGTIYSYFKDKKDIYFAAFDYFFYTHVQPFINDLSNTPKPLDVNVFVNKWLDWFISLCVSHKQIMRDWELAVITDSEIVQYFNECENTLISSLAAAIDSPNINKKNLKEKAYLLFNLADTLGSEHAFENNGIINLGLLRKEITDLMIYMLTQTE